MHDDLEPRDANEPDFDMNLDDADNLDFEDQDLQLEGFGDDGGFDTVDEHHLDDNVADPQPLAIVNNGISQREEHSNNGADAISKLDEMFAFLS